MTPESCLVWGGGVLSRIGKEIILWYNPIVGLCDTQQLTDKSSSLTNAKRRNSPIQIICVHPLKHQKRKKIGSGSRIELSTCHACGIAFYPSRDGSLLL